MLEEITYEFYDEVDSTNDKIKLRARAGEKEGLVISADCQTAGKGRVGRVWKNPVAEQIATSILLRPEEVSIDAIPSMTILSAMAVNQALYKVCGLRGEIKWPNDLVVNKKKICGILHEMELKDGGIAFVVAGIGVNVHNKSFPEDIAFKATSVDLELEAAGIDKKVDRRVLTEAIWESFKGYYNKFLETRDLTGVKEEYESQLANKGKPVRIEDPNGAYEAVCLGINEKGALVVDVDGEKREIESGEVSVRGLYGYV